jgi:hypothetical protein
MDTRALIVEEINHIPDNTLHEVLDFVRFLKSKTTRETIETAIASESSLKKDWLLPEEDIAWQDL